MKRLHDDEKLTSRAIATQLGSNFSSARRAYLRALEPVPMHANAPDGAVMHAHARFDDPADAQSVRWNLTLPRGLKRRLQKQAKALGIDETKRVQALLWRGLEAEEAAQ